MDSIKSDLISNENKYWQAMIDKDVDTALELTEFPCLVAGCSGVAKIERDAFIGMMKNAKHELLSFELSNFEVRILSNEVAVVAYQVTERLKVDGKEISAQAADTSTWILRDGKWLCAMHSEAMLGDPFGAESSKQDAQAA